MARLVDKGVQGSVLTYFSKAELSGLIWLSWVSHDCLTEKRYFIPEQAPVRTSITVLLSDEKAKCAWLKPCLFSCRHLFVHDLVTSEEARGTGCGTQLMQWLEQQARGNGCSRRAACAACLRCYPVAAMLMLTCYPLLQRPL